VNKVVLGIVVVSRHSVHWHLFSYCTICWQRSFVLPLHSGVFCAGADEHCSKQGGAGVVGNGPVEPMSVEPISPMAAFANKTYASG
jgi:hypothetical protein